MRYSISINDVSVRDFKTFGEYANYNFVYVSFLFNSDHNTVSVHSNDLDEFIEACRMLFMLIKKEVA